MSKIIKVTCFKEKGSIYINVEQIGHFYQVLEEIKYGRVEEKAHTRLGVTTHNNGGFQIVETPEELMELISQ
jgi:hypothetical protein